MKAFLIGKKIQQRKDDPTKQWYAMNFIVPYRNVSDNGYYCVTRSTPKTPEFDAIKVFNAYYDVETDFNGYIQSMKLIPAGAKGEEYKNPFDK